MSTGKRAREEPERGTRTQEDTDEPASKRAKTDVPDGTVEDDDEEAERETQKEDPGLNCPYLDTIERPMLDFDFEKLCSVTLSNQHVYACLVCGKYFQGRGKNSHAYFHSLQNAHHIFIHLENMKVYCLPENYEVKDNSLNDIKYVLNPTFTKAQIAQLDRNTEVSRGLDGSLYLPGFVGLNNIKHTDYLNVVVQCLVHVAPLRDFFINVDNLKNVKSPLVHAFGELVRKMWNPRNFKGHVSPHELMQAIMTASKKRFHAANQSDPVELLSFLLNQLHRDLGGTAKMGSSVIHETFQGQVRVLTEKTVPAPDGQGLPIVVGTELKEVPLYLLALDVPPPPLYHDPQLRNVIPQEPLFVCLMKFDGRTVQDITLTGERKRHIITQLPKYLIIHIKRFTKNTFFLEKNPTIVTFPIKNLEMRDYCDMETLIANALPGVTPTTKYNLVANVCHEGLPEPNQGTYRVHVRNRANDQWHEIEDLVVKEIMPQMIAVSEAYLQVYELQDTA